MKTILVLTDFSEYALNALKMASMIAKKTNAQIKLVHTYSIVLKDDDVSIECNNRLKASKDDNLRSLSRLDFLKSISVITHLEEGIKPWVLVTNARYKNADLIVIGSHGESKYHKLFIGSNAEKIIKMAETPVLTVKKYEKEFSVKNIIFASNFKEKAYSSFDKINFFVKAFNTHIDLLKVISPKNFESTDISKNLMTKFAKTYNLSNYSINIYNDLTIEDGILSFSQNKENTVLSSVINGRTGINRIISRNIAEKIIDDIKMPVLTIKTKEEINTKNQSQKADYENWGSE